MTAALPSGDPYKFTTIAHADHRYMSPLSAARAAALVDLFALARGDRVLDIGCGRARFLMEVLAAHPAVGIGVDANAALIALGNAAARELRLSARVTLIAEPLADAVPGEGDHAAVICMDRARPSVRSPMPSRGLSARCSRAVSRCSPTVTGSIRPRRITSTCSAQTQTKWAVTPAMPRAPAPRASVRCAR